MDLGSSTRVLCVVFVTLSIFCGLCDGLDLQKTIKKSCTAQTDKGMMDLTPVAHTDGTSAAFQATGGAVIGAPTIFWNPCQDTTLSGKTGCDSTANSGELFQSGFGSCTTLATMDDSKFAVNGDNLQLVYSGSGGVGSITFKCGKPSSPDQAFIADTTSCAPSQTQNCFVLTDPHCCFKNVPITTPVPGGGKGGGLSVGSILLIVVLVLAVVYVIAGIIVMKFVKGAEGAELCPNVGFWKSIPVYVKDGFMFTIRGCKPSASSYQDI